LTINGFWIFDQINRLSSGADPDCFHHVGDFLLCDANQHISIYNTLFFLLVQALISRLLLPGMSIFVNASVSRLLLMRSFIMFEYAAPHALQVLQDNSDRDSIESVM
jgi:hypothetical protein